MGLVTVRRPANAAGVVELVLARGAALNALSTELAGAVADEAARLAADRSVRAVVVSSADPRAFCAGADLEERQRFSDDDLLRQRKVFRAAFGAVLGLPVPTVAAVHGYALGGGLELALSCDLIVADTTAVVGLPEVSVGLTPGGGGTQLLARRVGWGRAADVVLTARRIDADEAYRLGIADRLVPAGQAAAEALALASVIAAHSPVALRAAKRALRGGADLPLALALDVEDEAWRTAAFSADRSEGLAAFATRRRPVWTGDERPTEGRP